MFKKIWKAFDSFFEAFDDDLEAMEADNHRRLEKLREHIDKAPDGVTTEVIREEEVRPDGTRITRITTTTRSVEKTTKKQ